ncbi:MAG: YgaP family membrane protein [Candidatus Micrarchaeia archaeon]
MEYNISVPDRIVRIVFSVLFIGLALYFQQYQIPLVIAGIIVLATAIIGFCPLYKLLGVPPIKQ